MALPTTESQMTNHFFAVDPQGRAHTRSSKGRTYTHTVVFLRGQAFAARELESLIASARRDAPKTYAYEVDCAAGQGDKNWGFRMRDDSRAQSIREGQEFLATYPTVEAYVDHVVQRTR